MCHYFVCILNMVPFLFITVFVSQWGSDVTKYEIKLTAQENVLISKERVENTAVNGNT